MRILTILPRRRKIFMRRRSHRRKSQKGGAPKWMVTYSDMVTLILVFFVLLFSMSQIDLVKFEAVSDSFRSRMVLDFFPSNIPAEHPSEHPDLQSDRDPGGMNTEKPFPSGDGEHDDERSEEHTSELQSRGHLVCRLLL